jgi:hypothetical protein
LFPVFAAVAAVTGRRGPVQRPFSPILRCGVALGGGEAAGGQQLGAVACATVPVATAVDPVDRSLGAVATRGGVG